MAMAANIAIPSLVNVSCISAATPATPSVTPFCKSNLSIFLSAAVVAFEISSPIIVPDTVAKYSPFERDNELSVVPSSTSTNYPIVIVVPNAVLISVAKTSSSEVAAALASR